MPTGNCNYFRAQLESVTITDGGDGYPKANVAVITGNIVIRFVTYLLTV